MPIVTIDLPSRNKSTVGWWLESILCVVSDTISLAPGASRVRRAACFSASYYRTSPTRSGTSTANYVAIQRTSSQHSDKRIRWNQARRVSSKIQPCELPSDTANFIIPEQWAPLK
jgi:hypothetical protein